jgi:uncharacterized membrane protein (UPF0182 family)
LLQTYQQSQAIRLYYQFYDVNTDRYHLADGYHQVVLSTRELAPELPARARTWVNQYLQFTHGYGVVMNFVSKTVGGGFPRYLLENVPTEAAYGLQITQPSIYYGGARARQALEAIHLRLETGRDIDAIAVNVASLDDDVAQIDADAKFDASLARHSLVVLRNRA